MSVEVGKFYAIGVDKYEKELGIGKGQIVYIAGSGTVPASEDDPYLFRLAFIAAQVVDRHIIFSEDYKGFAVDGRDLKGIPTQMQEELLEVYKKDFGVGPEVSEVESTD